MQNTPFTISSVSQLFRQVLPLLAMLALGACGQSDTPSSDPETVITPVAAYEVRTHDLSRPLRLAATVEPKALIRLAARTSGSVQEVFFEEGERVRRGQLLARIDVSEAAAELARTQAELAFAELDFNRAQELRRRGMAPELELQTARVAMQVAESHQALWQSRVAYGRIEAPQDSMVVARYIEPGEAVQTQDTLFELASMDQLVVRLGVSELDVVYLQTGQVIPLRLDALPELQLEGRVRRIFPAALGTSRLITVEVDLPSQAWEQGVRPGFLARIDSAIDPRPNTLVVPSAAIGTHEDGLYVYLIDGEQLSRRTIETGITRSRWTEITSGLEAGETILASNPIDMHDGQPVRIVTWQE